MNTWELLGLYYKLSGRMAWDAQIKLVTFDNLESAVEFKNAAPDWTVQYLKA